MRQTTAGQISSIRILADQGVDMVKIANQVTISTMSNLQAALAATFATSGGCNGQGGTAQVALALQKTQLTTFSDMLYFVRSAALNSTNPAVQAALGKAYSTAQLEEIFSVLQAFVVSSLVNLEVQMQAATTVNANGSTETRVAVLLNLNQRFDLLQVLQVIKMLQAVQAR